MKHEESTLQSSCVEWFKLQYPDKLIFAQMNGGYKISPQLARRFKRMGLQAGVPDLFIPHIKNGYGGLFIEMKLPSTKLTKEQQEMHIKLSENYYVDVCRTFEEFKESVEYYLGKR